MNQDSTIAQKTPTFKDIPIDALEQLRMRLSQLTHSLNKLQVEMTQSSTLQQWSSLQNQLGVILSQLTSLSATLDKHIEILNRTDVYPLNTFPTSQEEGLLTTLLRKKHLPEVTNWINESYEMVQQLSLSKDDKWCGWCLEKLESEIAEFVFSGFKTAEELKADADRAHDDALVVEQPTNTGYTPDQIYKFMYQGTNPK